MGVTIVNYRMGNLRSVQKAFVRLGLESAVTSDPEAIAKADRLVLPGVGHFGRGMQHLREMQLIEPLNDAVARGTPVLGICLGMQLMTLGSEEGRSEGLGWIRGQTRKFTPDRNKNIRVPHVGWNGLSVENSAPLLHGSEPAERFYFVHSYYVDCLDTEDICATTGYGVRFTSVFARKNVMGTQFHPEKSHESGLRLIENFSRMGRAE